MNLPTDPPTDPPPFRSPVSTDRPSRSDRMLVAVAVLALFALLGGMGVLAISRFAPGPSPATSIPAETGLATPPANGLATRPAPTATTVPGSPTAPTSSGTSSPVSIEEQVKAVEAQVPPLRGLEPTREVPNRVLDEAALREDMTKRFDEENPPAELAKQQALLVRLGYAESGLDLRSLYLDAMTTQVLGFYDDVTKSMNVVQRGDAFGPLERLTLAHEYTHALQDQRFDLASIQVRDPSQSDRALAHLAIVEGDASLLMALWAQRHLSSAELQDVVRQSSDPKAQAALDRLPLVLRTQLTFPYESGLMFVTRIYATGQWPAVDATYARLPETTEQILHSDKYAAGEGPVDVTLPAVPDRLGTGWSESAADTAGELGLRSWLETAGVDAAATAAAGWAGDRAGSYDGPNGAWAAAWVTRWDSGADAVEFQAAAVTAVGSMTYAKVGFAADGLGVTIAIASDAPTLEKLAVILGVGG